MKRNLVVKLFLLPAIFLAAMILFPGGPASGAPLPAGTNPFKVAFDGTNVWVANYRSNNVTKLRASDGAVQGTFAVGGAPAPMGHPMTSEAPASGSKTTAVIGK